jgi:hypothetical protein
VRTYSKHWHAVAEFQRAGVVWGWHAGGDLIDVADLDVAVVGHDADGASRDVARDQQATPLGDVHGVGAVLDAPGLAADVANHAADDDRRAFLDP